jgi:hypothetical protein
MSKLISARTAQFVMEAEFTFNFDDTMVSVAGQEVDFGKTNISATSFDIINLPENSVIIGGELVTETAFDTASYAVTIGDSAVADRYLASADRKGAARVALVPTGYRTSGSNLRIGITNADVCTAGKATVRVQYVIAGRANEVNPN